MIVKEIRDSSLLANFPTKIENLSSIHKRFAKGNVDKIDTSYHVKYTCTARKLSHQLTFYRSITYSSYL